MITIIGMPISHHIMFTPLSLFILYLHGENTGPILYKTNPAQCNRSYRYQQSEIINNFHILFARCLYQFKPRHQRLYD